MTRREFLEATTAFTVAGCAGVKPGEAPAVRFGFITDCHYAAHIIPKPGDMRAYPESLEKLREFVVAMNNEKVDFVIEGGDFKDLGRTPAESLKYLDEMESALAQFRGPRYHVLGNHDHDNVSKEEFLVHVSNEGQVAAQAYYAFECGGVKFVVLDACYRPDGEPYCRGNFFWKDAFVPHRQLDFLRAELETAKGWCVVILHQQLDAEDETCIANAMEVRGILERSGKVRCVVQGHIHEGCFHDIGGIGYYSQKASVIGPKEIANAYSVVELYPSGGVKVLGRRSAVSVEMLPRDGGLRRFAS